MKSVGNKDVNDPYARNSVPTGASSCCSQCSFQNVVQVEGKGVWGQDLSICMERDVDRVHIAFADNHTSIEKVE